MTLLYHVLRVYTDLANVLLACPEYVSYTMFKLNTSTFIPIIVSYIPIDLIFFYSFYESFKIIDISYCDIYSKTLFLRYIKRF